ncbi:Hypothetical predicted protein [Paramuricea clavata]|uniref:Uncharacterized protein n=1 Tax=Paramuricea clavata TaxID=317549 RepID=A0A6S7GD82_PARCT|nr:Hypothetical predicted protein [Paramuricea clavata]
MPPSAVPKVLIIQAYICPLKQFSRLSQNLTIHQINLQRSADVVALYPSLDIDFTIDKVCEVIFESNVKIDGVDYEEVGLYLALNIKPEMLKKIGIAEVCPTRKSNKGRPPTITGSGAEVQKDKCFKSWKQPTQQPSEHTKRVMLTEAPRVVLMMIMKNYVSPSTRKSESK